MRANAVVIKENSGSSMRQKKPKDRIIVYSLDEIPVFSSEDEEREWQSYEYAGHLIRMAKANAALKLKDR